MFAIRTYTNTKCELEIAKNRLNFLLDKKERLYHKYFPIVSKLKDISVQNSSHEKDKMTNYLHELHEVDIGTGKSLHDEIIYQQENIRTLEMYLNDMTTVLSQLKGVEYRLYYEIVVNGLNISNAVETVAEWAGKDTQTIWKNYYKKIKKEIKKLVKYTVKIQ